MHGARGVILINDTGNHTTEAAELEPFAKTAGPNNAGIPFVQITADQVEQWLKPSGKSLKAIQEAIDKDLEPQNFALDAALTAEMSIDVRRDVAADFRAAFGEAPPRITGIAVSADTDNTGERVTALFGDLRFTSRE